MLLPRKLLPVVPKHLINTSVVAFGASLGQVFSLIGSGAFSVGMSLENQFRISLGGDDGFFVDRGPKNAEGDAA